MTTVTGKLLGAGSPQRVEMKATLVDVTGKPAVGYVASVPGEVVKDVPIVAAGDGAWTVPLTANTLIESQSGDTLWAIQEGRARDGSPIVTYVAVPETGGPYWAGAIRAALSSTQTGQGTVVYLAGQKGDPGAAGASAYDVWLANGHTGSEQDFLDSLRGQGGGSNAYTDAAIAAEVTRANTAYDPAGAASSAQTAAATDAAGKVATHSADTTDVHGIADTAALETTTGAQTKASTAQSAAIAAAATDATAKVIVHRDAIDPHADRAYADGKLAKASNLSDLPSAAAARGNLGLGGAALLNVGTAASTVAAGDDSRVLGAAQKTQNLADLQSTATARTNLGLGGAAVLAVGTSAGTVAAGDDARIIGALQAAGGIISGNLAVTGNALGADSPAAHGVAAWCYDPALAVNSTQLTAGTLYLVRVNIAANVSATKIYWWVASTGSSAVAGQNLVGLYDSAGTLLASANVDASFSSATLKTTTIAATALSAGSFYWVGMVFNASVTPTLTRASGWSGVDTAANLGLAAAAYRFAKNGTGRTALPSSITPASNVGTDFAGPWAAVGA
jgi:hypothetical protein